MDLFRRRAAEFGAEFVDLATVPFTPDLLSRIPAGLARKFRVLPVAQSDHAIAIVTADPADLDTLHGLHSALGRDIEVRVADRAQINSFIEQFYGDDKPAT
jgi:type IV pilus assembly protein PilB